jgi:hypothetical protein
MTKELCDLNDGARFRYGGYEWVLLGDGNRLTRAGGQLCLMVDTFKDAPFSTDKHNNNWRTSSVREYLNEEFRETITGRRIRQNELLYYASDLTSDDGLQSGISDDKVFLLSVDDYRRCRYAIPNAKGWWWLITPHTHPGDNVSSPARVCAIFPSGPLMSAQAHYNLIGLRPAIYLRVGTEVETEAQP